MLAYAGFFGGGGGSGIARYHMLDTLIDRTTGFHPGNPGSIPGKVTIKGFIIHSDAKQLVYLW